MQQNDHFRLVVRRGPQPNLAFEVSKDLTTLGRDISNDIVINDRETSRHHLRLMTAGDTLTIEDLGSTNGTFVNGKRISGVTPLQNGDMIGLGETVTLALERVEAGMDAPASAPSNLGDLLPPAARPPQPERPCRKRRWFPPRPNQPTVRRRPTTDCTTRRRRGLIPTRRICRQRASNCRSSHPHTKLIPRAPPSRKGRPAITRKGSRPATSRCRRRRRKAIPVTTTIPTPRAKKAAAPRPG